MFTPETNKKILEYMTGKNIILQEKLIKTTIEKKANGTKKSIGTKLGIIFSTLSWKSLFYGHKKRRYYIREEFYIKRLEELKKKAPFLEDKEIEQQIKKSMSKHIRKMFILYDMGNE